MDNKDSENNNSPINPLFSKSNSKKDSDIILVVEGGISKLDIRLLDSLKKMQDVIVVTPEEAIKIGIDKQGDPPKEVFKIAPIIIENLTINLTPKSGREKRRERRRKNKL